MSLKRGLALLLVIASGLTVGTAGAQDVWETVQDAYLYAFPLVLMEATKETSTQVSVNQMEHARTLADDKMRLVVSPNVDTLYTQAWLDVSEEPMVYRLPETERFFSVQLLDMWTNTAAVLREAGDYAIVPQGYAGELPENVTRVEAPTTVLWMIGRAEVDGEDDIPRVAAFQDEMRLVPLSAYAQIDSYEPPKGETRTENGVVPIQKVLGMEPKVFFDEANRLMALYPPKEGGTSFPEIGVGAGLTFDAAALTGDVGEQWKAMLGGARRRMETKSINYVRLLGDWTYYGDPIGAFGTAYDYRALVALMGLGANPTSVAVYPKLTNDHAGEALTGEKTYVLHMEQTPPVKEKGFWSITAYGEDDFLMANPINRFCINDRSDCVYNEDGTLDIVLAHDAPENTANWLPVGEGGFHLFLRIYEPDLDALERWIPPEVTVSGD